MLSRMGDCIAIRILGEAVNWEYDKSLKIIQEFAKWCEKPVINMEDNKYHPCQGMADVMTLRELYGRDLRGRKLAVSWTWVHHPPRNRSHRITISCMLPVTLAQTSSLPIPLKCASTPRWKPKSKPMWKLNGGSYQVVDNMEDACENADVVYAKNYVCLDLLPPVTKEAQTDEMAKLFGKYKGLDRG